jgi:ubiquinone/menaquinone biosynthesis C-methylase UbiE
MIRKGIYKPTIEDIIEISGIETLHPGGLALTKRAAELAELKEGLKVLDVSSGRGTQSIFYSKEYNANVTGIDHSEEMVKSASRNAKEALIGDKVQFQTGDSQNLPFEDNAFDVVINECAVGIPDDPQKVLNEMIRVAKPGGRILIHESTWKIRLPDEEKNEFSERYGTTPFELDEWISMLKKAGAKNLIFEFEQWSKPEFFWKIRKDRDVEDWDSIMTGKEKLKTLERIFIKYGLKGIINTEKNRRIFYNTVLEGKLGYALFKGEK